MVYSCILVIVGEHPTLEKPGVQNLAACENEGKQWKPRMMKRKQQRMIQKKTKRLTEIQVLIKDLT